MNTDYMIGDSYGENVISPITLAMFEDSGWYKPDYSKSNQFLWGKGNGCFFFVQFIECVSKALFSNDIKSWFTNSFCTKMNYPVCSVSNKFRGDCRTKKWPKLGPFEQYLGSPNISGVNELASKCPIPIENKGSQKYYGGSCSVGQTQTINKFEKVCPDCACFMSNLREIPLRVESDKQLRHQNALMPSTNENPSESKMEKRVSLLADPENVQPLATLMENDYRTHCFEFFCTGQTLNVKVLNKTAVCKDNQNVTIPGYQGVIQCPPASVLCDTKYKCKFGC